MRVQILRSAPAESCLPAASAASCRPAGRASAPVGRARAIAGSIGAAAGLGGGRAAFPTAAGATASRQVRREPAAALENKFRRVLLQVQIIERGVPVGVSPAPPLDSFFPRPFEKRQRLPAGFFLGLLGPALVFLELLVDLLLGLGILALARLGVALKRLAHLVASPGVLRLQRLVVDLVLGGELARDASCIRPLLARSACESPARSRTRVWRDRRSALPDRSVRRFLFERVATQA